MMTDLPASFFLCAHLRSTFDAVEGAMARGRRHGRWIRPLLRWIASAGLVGALHSAAAAEGAGEQVYEEHCAACHGERLRASGSARDLREIGAHERERFDKVVLEGKGQMPPWRGVLEPEQVDQVWAFIRSIAD
jgi:mono/diheme cytochrome c family protein